MSHFTEDILSVCMSAIHTGSDEFINCNWDGTEDAEVEEAVDEYFPNLEKIIETNPNEVVDMPNVEDITKTNPHEDEDNKIMMIVSPTVGCTVKPESKRGRKRRYPEGKRPERQQKKVKVYELDPLADPEAERKRQNAVNAKRHRDLQKKVTEELHNSLHQITKERDELKRQVEMFQRRADALQAELDSYQATSPTFLNY